MMRLIYGITSRMAVTISETYFGSRYQLYFADNINATPPNASSSNPFKIFQEYTDIVANNDRKNPKYIAHRRGLQRAIRVRLGTPQSRLGPQRTMRAMGTHGMQPYLAILEVETYLNNHHPGMSVSLIHFQLPPSQAGSPASVEYMLRDIAGPHNPNPEMHLQQLHL
jgi:hypothetical protein